MKEERAKFKEFIKTSSGFNKFALLIFGVVLGLLTALIFGYLTGHSNVSGNYNNYDYYIFVIIFLLVLTGELIGIYFGALEQFNLQKKEELLRKQEETKKLEVSKKTITKTPKKTTTSKAKTPKKTNTTKKKTNKNEKNN